MLERHHDVGGGDANGVNLSELTDIVVKAVFSAIVKSGADLPKAIGGVGRLFGRDGTDE